MQDRQVRANWSYVGIADKTELENYNKAMGWSWEELNQMASQAYSSDSPFYRIYREEKRIRNCFAY